jgi:antitoxin (DNA-binding transcriptional repressor) of toxin-antitoxin stability system
MTTATVRNLRYDFPTILKRLEHGEEVAITLRGKLICTLVPAEAKEPQTVLWPDVTKRLRKLHGKRMLHPVNSILKLRESER